jgi:hypothetical protein
LDQPGDVAGFAERLQACLANGQLNLIIVRQPCVLVAGKIRQYERDACPTCTEAVVE